MINAHLYAPEIMALLQSGLDPDERGIAVCDFAITGTENTVTAVLTNRNIRFMGFKTNWLGKNPQLVANAAVAVRTISGISTAEGKPALFGPKVFQLIFWWEGHNENLVTQAIPEGKAFVEKLKLVVAGRDVAPARTGVADELQKLAMLTREGILSEDDWARAKDHLIGVPASQVDEATQLLRQLHALRAQGVLSESEFNMKKWDILSQRLISRDRPPTPPPTRPTSHSGNNPLDSKVACPHCNVRLSTQTIRIGMNSCPHCGGEFEAE